MSVASVRAFPVPRPRADILGAGSSGLLHGLSIRAAGGRVGSVYDPDIERARALASVLGARAVREPTEIAQGNADVVCVASPPPWHVAQAVMVARPGRLVFVEKPLALCALDLRRLGDLPGVVPVVQWRRGRAARALRAAFETGWFGPTPHLRFDVSWPRDDAYYFARRRAVWGCGALLSIGIHAVDLGLWALGARVASDVRGAIGSETWTRSRVDVPTAAKLLVETASGATLELRLSTDGTGPERTRVSLQGDGLRAQLLAGEADPTTAPLIFSGPRAELLEQHTRCLGGEHGPPLLVPYVAAALDGDLVGVADVALAHEIVFRVVAQSAGGR